MDTVVLDKGNKDTQAAASVINQALASGEGIIKGLMQASMSNPLMGVVASIVTLDILHNTKIISDSAYWAGMSLVIAAAGVDLAGTILTDIEDVLPFTAPSKDLTTPSGSVLVFGEADMAQLNALLAKVKSST